MYLSADSHLAVQMNQTVLATILNAIGGSLLQVAWQPVAELPDAGLNQFVLFRLCMFSRYQICRIADIFMR